MRRYEHRRRHEERDPDLRHLKLSFLTFEERDDAASWVLDCEKYFDIYQVKEQRMVPIAAMHLHGVPKSWYKAYCSGKGAISLE